MALVLAVWLGGCGFQFAPYRGGEVVGNVVIEGLDNDSFEPGVEATVLDALHRVFLRRGVLTLVDDPAQADFVIGGIIEPIQTRSRSFSSVTLALEYEVTMRLSLDVLRVTGLAEDGLGVAGLGVDGNEVVLDGTLLQESEFYLASADVEVLRRNRREALLHVSDVIASRIHDALYEHLLQ